MSDKKEQFSKMRYFTVATRGRAKDLKMVENGVLSMDSEQDGFLELEPGLIPDNWCTCLERPISDGCPCLETPESEHVCRIFLKIEGQVYMFDHTTGDGDTGDVCEPTVYAIDLDNKRPRFEELTNKRFYPDMAEIWCCQNSAGHRKIITLVESEGER